jgi:hypothetical protein
MHADEKKRIPYMQMKRKEDHVYRCKAKMIMHADGQKRLPCMKMKRKEDNACR